MQIDKVTVDRIIKIIPQELRTAAREERLRIIRAAKEDPISTAFNAAYGKVDFSNNFKLQKLLKELNYNMAEETYKASKLNKGPTFVDNMPPVVKASMNLD